MKYYRVLNSASEDNVRFVIEPLSSDSIIVLKNKDDSENKLNSLSLCLPKTEPTVFQIDCEKALNETKSIDLTGTFDVFIDGVLIKQNITPQEMIYFFNESSQESLLITEE